MYLEKLRETSRGKLNRRRWKNTIRGYPKILGPDSGKKSTKQDRKKNEKFKWAIDHKGSNYEQASLIFRSSLNPFAAARGDL
jgi:hypothetical protein